MLKNHTGAKNSEEITQAFLSEYERNYEYYKFINELYKSLEEEQHIQQELIKKKDEVLEEVSKNITLTKH